MCRSRTRWALPGSSPRMRGTRQAFQLLGVPPGLIPTYAGNTTAAKNTNTHHRAHPHVCGEHVSRVEHGASLLGSSPRMRGTPHSLTLTRTMKGLIPTYAGNTGAYHTTAPTTGAHPHVCGEHSDWVTNKIPQAGSSPRMRGTPGVAVDPGRDPGLIPTYAGNTLADMGFYPHTPSFRISLEPKASINPARFLGLSPSGSAPIPASFAPPFSWP